MQPIHLVIGAIEGVITGTVLSFIYETRPELLWNPNNSENKENKISYKKELCILISLFIIIGAGISLLASSNPDGLEWSIQKLTGNTEIETSNSEIFETAKNMQETTALLPDYSITNNETIGTSISGIVGSVITLGVLCLIGFVIKQTRRKGKSVNE